MRFCAACHGQSGTGDGPVAAGLPITVPDLTRLEARKGGKFEEELLRKDYRRARDRCGARHALHAGLGAMKFWVEEGADEEARERVDLIVDNLVEYIRSIQRPE